MSARRDCSRGGARVHLHREAGRVQEPDRAVLARGARRPPSATSWPCSRSRATCRIPTPAPGGSPPTGATGSTWTPLGGGGAGPGAGGDHRPVLRGGGRPRGDPASGPRCCCPASPTTRPWSPRRPWTGRGCATSRWSGSGRTVIMLVLIVDSGRVEKRLVETAEDVPRGPGGAAPPAQRAAGRRAAVAGRADPGRHGRRGPAPRTARCSRPWPRPSARFVGDQTSERVWLGGQANIAGPGPSTASRPSGASTRPWSSRCWCCAMLQATLRPRRRGSRW
jgi:hypothetical protein